MVWNAVFRQNMNTTSGVVHCRGLHSCEQRERAAEAWNVPLGLSNRSISKCGPYGQEECLAAER